MGPPDRPGPSWRKERTALTCGFVDASKVVLLPGTHAMAAGHTFLPFLCPYPQLCLYGAPSARREAPLRTQFEKCIWVAYAD
jgi:hypothetical protein